MKRSAKSSGSVLGNNVIGNQCGLRHFGFTSVLASGPGPDPADNVCSGLATVSPFAAAPFNVANPLPAPSVYRINAGGPAYTSSSGVHWIADSYYNTGTTFSKVVAIANTTDGDQRDVLVPNCKSKRIAV